MLFFHTPTSLPPQLEAALLPPTGWKALLLSTCYWIFCPSRDIVHWLEYLNSNTILGWGWGAAEEGSFPRSQLITFRWLILFLRGQRYSCIIPLVLTPTNSSIFLLLQPLQGTTGGLGLLAADPH